MTREYWGVIQPWESLIPFKMAALMNVYYGKTVVPVLILSSLKACPRRCLLQVRTMGGKRVFGGGEGVFARRGILSVTKGTCSCLSKPLHTKLMHHRVLVEISKPRSLMQLGKHGWKGLKLHHYPQTGNSTQCEWNLITCIFHCSSMFSQRKSGRAKHNQPDRLLQPCFSTTSTVYSHHWRWRMHILAHSASVMDMMSGHGDSAWKAKIDWQKLQVFFWKLKVMQVEIFHT